MESIIRQTQTQAGSNYVKSIVSIQNNDEEVITYNDNEDSNLL